MERLHGQRFETIRQAKDETIAWLLWYNRTRLHSTLSYVSPIEFEQDWNDAMVSSLHERWRRQKTGRGNDGLRKARKTMVLFSDLPTNLGNR